MIDYLLDLDTALLVSARKLVWPEYSLFIQFFWEIIVLWGIFILVGLWLRGTLKKNDENKRQSLRIFATIVTVFFIYGVVNLWLPQWRPSPDEIAWGIAPLIPHPIGNSFPSGHALFSVALFMGILYYVPLRRNILLLTTMIFWVITALARVVWGVHYPGDIVGGLILWTLIACLSRQIVTGKLLENKFYPWCIRIAKFFKL